MARNGSGTYNLYVPGNPVVTGTTISSTWANNTLNDIATALTNSIAKDGQTTPTANLPMGTFKFTGLGAGSVNGDSLRYEQVVGVYLPLSGGSLTGTINQAKGASVAAAATTEIWTTDGNLIHITGTGGPITSFGTAVQPGSKKTLIIDSAGVVITNGANLVCPDGLNLTSLANMVIDVVADTTTLHRITSISTTGIIYNGTAVATTSGTAPATFTTIPLWAKKIKILFAGVSTNGTANWICQLGTAGAFVTTGYVGAMCESAGAGNTLTNITTGLGASGSVAAVNYSGYAEFELLDPANNIWVGTALASRSDGAVASKSTTRITLAGFPDRVRIVSTDTFDLGSANVVFE